MRNLLICLFYAVLFNLSLTSCTIYEIDLQQGNVLDVDAVAKIKKGMTKQQIQFILGSPIIQDPFHPNRWDYVHTFKPGKGEMTLRSITIYFENDKMLRFHDSQPIENKTEDKTPEKSSANKS